ncbi:MAG TPA: NADPH-dependent FMN reductase [Dehalococcoidia bacterium]|nr:NADPH-dependent FMN reductase [Dehalococcoidia bacterium]
MGPLLVIAGSIRVERRSFQVAEYVRDRLAEFTSGVELIDPRDYLLPPYDGVAVTAASRELAQRCLDASGFVFVCPEWHAGVPGTLKNMLDYLGAAQFSGKPVGLVSVSSAMGGAIVLSQLRDIIGVLGAALIGPFVPVRNVKAAFDESGRLADERFEAYLLGALRNLVRAREALAAVPQR